jgi:prepilin-type processing-associated H-X9-DG protein
VRDPKIAGVVVLAVLAVLCAGPAAADERPLASLVPADAAAYSEIHVDRMLGRAPETAALAEVFSKMQSPQIIRQMFAQDEEANRGFEEVVGALKSAADALGPRVGVATWLPDMGSILGGMMGATGPKGMGGALPMMPKVLVVADLRDAAAFDALATQLAEKLELPARVESRGAEGVVTSFAEGMVEMIRGEDWVAVAFPAEQARRAADRARGEVTGGSLWEDPAYQDLIEGLPDDAMFTEYVSAAAVRQLIGIVGMFAPDAKFSYPTDKALGVAMGVRVEEQDGRRMATAYYTADLDAVPYLIDAPLALQAAVALPAFQRSRESARKAVCLSNMKNLSLAMQMFLADNNDRFPDADRWVAALEDYVRNADVLKCPSDESDAVCSYAMNSALSGASMADVFDPVFTIVFFETRHPGDNPVGGIEDVVAPGRHNGGNSYGFADGHVEWLEEVPSFSVR